jgi:hypothetical protein
VRKIGDTPTGTAQSGGEPERGGGPPLSVGVRGEGRALALCRVQERGPSPRTQQRGGRCSQYSALRSNGGDFAVVAASTRKDYVRVEVFDRRARDLARALGPTRGNLSAAARHGAVQAARWQAEIPRWCR